MNTQRRQRHQDLSLKNYRSYLYFSASNHLDGFIAPSDWLCMWNLQQWMLDPRNRSVSIDIPAKPRIRQNIAGMG
jgi:hypothetical protein